MAQPWIPPTTQWNDVTLLKRIPNGQELTFGQGDLNKTDAENAINWLGNKIFEIMSQIGNVHQTGEVLMSFQQNPPTGYIPMKGETIGSAVSGSNYTGLNFKDLYDLLWIYAENSDLRTSSNGATTKGASSDADWSSNKRLILPDSRGTVMMGAGQRTGLTNRIIMRRYGVEDFTSQHSHAMSITTSQAVINYIPGGSITVFDTPLSYNPSPSITVADFVGDILPSGTVTIAPFNQTITPAGSLSITGTASIGFGEDPILVDGVSCINVQETQGSETSTIDCGSVLSIDPLALSERAAISLELSGTFTGTPFNIDHTHNATFTGNTASITHGHTATIAGLDADLTHSHSASFVGNAVNLSHDHQVIGNTSQATIVTSTIQPSLAINMFIKL